MRSALLVPDFDEGPMLDDYLGRHFYERGRVNEQYCAVAFGRLSSAAGREPIAARRQRNRSLGGSHILRQMHVRRIVDESSQAGRAYTLDEGLPAHADTLRWLRAEYHQDQIHERLVREELPITLDC